MTPQPSSTTGSIRASADDVVVRVDAVVKHFGRTAALDGVSFAVHPGETFGLIGPDGAGKTTLLRILTTLLVPESGIVRVLGEDVVAAIWRLRRVIGYMPSRFSLYPDLSVRENLRFFAAVFGTTVDREYQHIAPIYAQLEAFNDRRAADLSGGMKQKLALCCALVHRPKILFLDEPTTGVDAVSRREFWDLLGELTAAGLTVLVSTPYMDEANRCDRVALIQRGRLLAIDTPAAVAASFDRPLFAVRVDEPYRALLTIRQYPHTHTVYPFGDVHHYTDARLGEETADTALELQAFLEAHGFPHAQVERTAPTVEDRFMALMGDPEAPPQGTA